MKEVSLIIFGWALGLLSPLIAEWFKKPQEAKSLMRAIKSEARDTQYRLAGCAFSLVYKHGKLDKEFLTWAIQTLEKYDGPEKQINLDYFRKIKELDDAQFLLHRDKLKSPPGVASGLKTFPTSFLDAMLPRVEKLPIDFQQRLHTIKYKIFTINQQVEDAKQRRTMTFDTSISEGDRQRINSNIQEDYKNIAKQCRFTSDHIDKLLEYREPSVLKRW